MAIENRNTCKHSRAEKVQVFCEKNDKNLRPAATQEQD